MLTRVEDHLPEIRAICAHYSVHRLETYEESAYDEHDVDESPVRFLVDFGPVDAGNLWHTIDLALALEGAIGRFVILTERRLGDQRYLAATAKERVTIYESRKQKAAA